MNANCLVVMFHYVRDTAQTPYPGLNALSPHDFDAQLDLIAAARRVVSYSDFERAVLDRRPLAEPAALLTFDDGFADHYEVVLCRLTSRQMSGVFFLAGAAFDDPPRVLNVHKTHFLIETLGAAGFAQALQQALDARPVAVASSLSKRPEVYRYDGSPADAEVKHFLNYELPFETADDVLNELFSAHVGDEADFARTLYLSHDQIRDMTSAGMTFGFHSEQHRVLSRLSPSAQQHEVQRGVARIRALTGQHTVPFCYPYGHPHTYTTATVSALRESGYTTAFTTTRRAADPVTDEPLELPRYDTRDLPPFTSSLPDA